MAGLPPACKALHAGFGAFDGRITVTPADTRGMRLLARVMGLPPAARNVPFRLVTEPDGQGARWIREIGETRMVSRLFATVDGLLAERLGLARVDTRLVTEAGGLRLVTERVAMLGMPVPRALWPRVVAREWQDGGLYRFDVAIALPLLGRLVSYTGQLDTLPTQNDPAQVQPSQDL
ncbi:DUF4166 domain-containing protein [Sagittula stellata]|uniref:DUF4166 domain-containing protein n=2 Tax=Sagittula stellata TaxID=52603 RepID=A3JYW7_SAGS3|nr:hypothetical protein SSE37_07678 [Sagittula stellata E-37]